MSLARTNIYRKEIRSYRRSSFFWTLGIIFFLLAAMSKYLGYSRSGTSINEMINSLPAGFSAFFGTTAIDLQTAGGYYTVCVLYLSVMLGVHAVLLGSGIIGKEETDRTIEFLYARPVSRNQILFSKLLAALTIILTLNIVTLLSSVIMVPWFNDGPSITGDILLLMPGMFFIQLFFLMVGVAFAAVMRRPKRAGMFSAAILLATFIISSFVDISDKYGFLRYTTPFKYFDPKTIFAVGSYNIAYIVIMLATVTILGVGSGMAFKKRDFNV
ncbi:MAG: ABC transporter permease subunit [Thermoleophilia bacterium]